MLPSFGNGLDVLFYASGTSQLNNNLGGGDRTVRSLTFDENADSSFTIYLSSDNNDSSTARVLTLNTDRHGFAGNETSILVRPGATGNFTIGSGLGSITLADPLIIHHAGSGTLTIKRPINESGGAKSVTKSGSGEVTLEGANTFTGGIFIRDGKLALNSTSSENNEPDIFVENGGTLSLGSPFAGSTATIGNLSGSGLVDPQYGSATGTRTLRVNQTSDGTFSGNLNDATSGGRVLAVKKNGAARLTLAGTANTYSGGTEIYEGLLRVSADGSLGASGGDITFTGGGSGVLMNNDSAVTLNSGRQINLTGNGAFRAGWTKSLTIAGKITGAGGLTTKTDADAAAIILSNSANDYAGGTTIETDSVLQLGANNVLPDTTSVSIAGTLDLNGKSDTIRSLQISSGATCTGTGTLTFDNAGAWGINLTSGAGSKTIPWNIVLGSQAAANNNLDFGCQTAGDVLTLSGVVSSPSGYGFDVWPSASTVVLGNANTYTGLTCLFGTLRLGVNNAIKAGNNVQFSNGTLDVNGKTQTLDQLTGSGTVLLGGGALTLGSGGSSFTVSAVISENGSLVNGSLVKSGAGTVTLSGANTFTGTTTVSNGTLLVSGALGPSAVTVRNGATLGGSGVISGAVSVQSGGSLSPGASIGTLTASNSLTLNSGSTVFVELNAANGQSDRVQGLTSVSYAGSLVVSNLAGPGTATNGQSFQIFNAVPSATGNFGSITPAPGGGLYWSFNPASGQLIATSTVPVVTTTLIPAGALWRYLDDGSDQGTTWRARTFNDAAWKMGPAQLGYGDGDEATVVSYGPVATNKFVTTWFRRSFTLANASLVTNLAASLLRDDGAVVYLNGTEVWRSNMPTNTAINSTTFASSLVSGTDENTWHTTNFNPALLVNGTNVIAVEVHQDAVTSSDISFDFALTATSTGALSNQPPDLLLVQPSEGQPFAAPANVAVSAFALDPDGSVAKVEFYSGLTKIGERTTAPFSLTLSNLPVGDYTFSAIATDDSGATSASLNAPTIHVLPPVPATLLPAGAVWKYFDQTNDLGTAWRSNAFNDAGWSNGPARLGFGNDGEVTKVASNRQWTTYFRRSFYVPDTNLIANLTARLTRDDGAVVYLNGAEVWRDTNMPSGTITNQTPALSALGGTNETNWLPLDLQPSTLNLLQSGWNRLAAEVHQATLTSSDLGSDFELTGVQAVVAQPELSFVSSSGVLTLAWPASHGVFTLVTATNLPPPVWTRATNEPVLSNGVWLIPLPATTNETRFFRLQTP